MGRPKKYNKKTEIISFACDPEIIEHITEIAKKENISRSDYINQIIKHVAYSEIEYARMMMKKAARDMYYWKGRKEMIENEN